MYDLEKVKVGENTGFNTLSVRQAGEWQWTVGSSES